MAPIRVLIADAQSLFSEVLAVALNDNPDIAVLDDRPTAGLQAVEAVLRSVPDVALLDLWMEGMEGPAATRAILAKAPKQKVMIMSSFEAPGYAERALSSGAVAYLLKTVAVDQLADAIRQAHSQHDRPDNGRKRSTGASIEGADPADLTWERLVSLTSREVEILSLLAVHGRVASVAAEISIAQGTLRNHIHSILNKLQVHSQVEAIALARHYGLI